VKDFIIVFGYGGGKSRREEGRKKDPISNTYPFFYFWQLRAEEIPPKFYGAVTEVIALVLSCMRRIAV
jgi:hypothetical protein